MLDEILDCRQRLLDARVVGDDHLPIPLVERHVEIRTVAGTGVKGFSGDGGPAVQAQINNPFGLVRGPDGALYLCDCDNHRVRRIAPDGTISTYAGNGTRGHSGDGGPATEAAMDQP